jgi:hypothetical protein
MSQLFFMVCALLVCGNVQVGAQENEGAPARPFVKGGFYDKPHLFKLASGKVNVGGYAEAHFRFEKEDGIVEERTFVPKRFNLFFHSFVSERFSMAAELEFEEGTEEILLELAILDFELHPAVTFRGGMLLSPLGKFNLAHDSPSNKMTDRPLVSTQIIPTALSEPGAGFFGAFYPSANMRMTYELYAVNGFDSGVVEESDAGTRIAEGRHNIEDNNNSPAFTGRFGIGPTARSDFGFSFHHGQYNKTFLEDISIDEARHVTLWALDGEYSWHRFAVLGEYASASVDLPPGLAGSIYASKQQGFYLQGSASFLQSALAHIPNSYFEGVVRYDWVDLDTDLTGDHHTRLTLGVNFRPSPDSVFKFNYLYNWSRDRNNVEALGAGVLCSVATYF